MHVFIFDVLMLGISGCLLTRRTIYTIVLLTVQEVWSTFVYARISNISDLLDEVSIRRRTMQYQVHST